MVTASIGLNIGQEAHRLGSLSKDEQDSIEKAVMRILSFHVGRSNVISGNRMWEELKAKGLKVTETKIFRDEINKLRKEGWPIGSTGGKNGGYWLCKDRIELHTVINNQFKPFENDLRTQRRAMLRAANLFYGSQMSLFDARAPEEIEKIEARRMLQAKVRRYYKFMRGNA
jgi:predicted DNA-binding transcriptional regulator YafY